MAEIQTVNSPTSAGVSVPAFEQNLVLNTLQAQKVMRRVFSRAAGSLYRIDVILRIISGDEDAARVEHIINDMITKVEKALLDSGVELEAALEVNGIDGLPIYDAPTKERVRITSPHVARFLSLVRKLDELVAKIDALWLSGLMANKERNDSVYRWQQRVIGLGSQIIGLERRAREAAKNQGKSGEVDAQVPVSSEEIEDLKDDVISEQESPELEATGT